MDPSLLPFFDPKGVAVIGASNDQHKLGYDLARNLVTSGYSGAVYFVNRKGGRVLNRQVYREIAAVPDPVDLAVILIPARYVPEALSACGARGIRAVIVGSGGFRETGEVGAALEEECLRTAGAQGIRLVGPNCIGLIDTHLPIDTTFLPSPSPYPGDIGFIAHSGAICAAVIDWSRGQGFGLSRLASLGNQADLGETDLLLPIVSDPHTRVLAMYLEGVKDGRQFVENARQAAAEKPLIALKSGRSKSGQQAAASHTGALAGQDEAYEAAFRRGGVLRADTMEDMFDYARALAWSPEPAGRRVAVLTNAGGPGVIAADALEARGLKLAVFGPETTAALDAVLAPEASLHNPVDMVAGASPEDFATCLQIVLDDPGVDSVLLLYPTPPLYTAGAVARRVIPVIHQAEKPVLVSVLGEELIGEATAFLRAARIPEYRFPERAAAALAALTDRSAARLYAAAEPVQLVATSASTALVDSLSEGFLPAETVGALMDAYDIPHNPLVLAHTPDESVATAGEIGYPVVLKIAAPAIVHKSDAGGVALNLENETQLREAWDAILSRITANNPDAPVQGCYVQGMVPEGQEVIVGTVQDPQFGPLVMFGSGGVEVEGLGDVAFALAPLTGPEAQYLLENTWAGRKLAGFRHLPPADRDAVVDVLYRLAQLAADYPQLAEIEINPLRVLPEGQGAVAVDVRARLAA